MNAYEKFIADLISTQRSSMRPFRFKRRPSSRSKMSNDHCTSCGSPWADHMGIAPTCEELRKERADNVALRDDKKTLAALLEDMENKSCKWSYDGEMGFYETSCGECWSFEAGKLKDNHGESNLFQYCPYCRGKIKSYCLEAL